ncbi:CBS domain-containing protein [Oceanicoccus sp. KOV_DT_Chl]|uniref:CBS domain-containing protein n=1 Tax=Oceanicoccus sp. KOV_DT_Chl TaxID=1904639 RepID=UPI001F26B4A0|nr:CBS domain-containing protein [Oceanicoccus sp. KOV_DT_Chl]
MSKTIVSVGMDDTLKDVKNIFDEHKFHHLLVIEKKKLCGIISDRDLFKAIPPNIDSISATAKDLAALNKRVHQIMTRNVISLKADAMIKDAVNIFNNNDISCIPIVDDLDQPIGILSWRDIMKAMQGIEK